MSKATFVYVIYIAAEPKAVWNALIDGEATKRYWDHLNVSDWKVGSKWEHQRADGTNAVDLVGTVVESAPPRRLVITWAFPSQSADPEQRSRVAFDIEPHAGESTRLTLTHDDLEAGSDMERGISTGWPLVLSNLKSLLESGKTMPLRG